VRDRRKCIKSKGDHTVTKATINTKLINNQRIECLKRNFNVVTIGNHQLEVTDTGEDLKELINRWKLPAAAVVWEE